MAWIPILLVIVAGLLALYEYNHTRATGLTCSYCEDRSLLPISVALILLVALGIAALIAAPSLLKKASGWVVVLALLVAVGASLEKQRVTFEVGSQFLYPSVGTVLQHLPRQGATIELEGFDEAEPNPVASLMFAYARADESDWNHVSVPADFNENTSLMYFGGLGDARPGLPNPEFHPHYGYVLTRLAGLENDRRLLSREGPVALEARSLPLDVLVDYGFTVASASADPLGVPFEDVWANEPIQVIVTGTPSARTYVGLWFGLSRSAPRVRVMGQHVVKVTQSTGSLAVCLETTGQPRAAPQMSPCPKEPRSVSWQPRLPLRAARRGQLHDEFRLVSRDF